MTGQEEISIKVNIGERQYPLKIQAAEEENVRKAARLITEKSKFYYENFSVRDKQDALSMAALEFATELLALKARTEQEDILTRDTFKGINLLLDKLLSAR